MTMNSPQKLQLITLVSVVAAHLMLFISLSFNSPKHQSGDTLGNLIVANLFDPRPNNHQQTKQNTIKKISRDTQITSTPTPADNVQKNDVVPQTGGAQSDGKQVNLSQAQCNIPEPIYPTLSRRMSEEGKVLVRLHINEAGSVEKINLVQSSGIQRLDQAALEAAQKARCKPFMEMNKPIKVTAIQPYIFRLE